MRCFVDGVYEYFVDYTEFEPMVNFADWQYPLTLLARQNRAVVDEFYPGQVDDLRIYNYEMEREAIGKLYYDVTNEPSCVYGSPDLDLSGPEGEPDCVVDLYDFAVFAADWLNSGLYDPQP